MHLPHHATLRMGRPVTASGLGCQVTFSMLEIYNEAVRDLLVKDASKGLPVRRLVEDSIVTASKSTINRSLLRSDFADSGSGVADLEFRRLLAELE